MSGQFAEPEPEFDFSHQHHQKPDHDVTEDTKQQPLFQTMEEAHSQASQVPNMTQIALARAGRQQNGLDEEIARAETHIQEQEAAFTAQLNTTLTPELRQRHFSSLRQHYDAYIALLMEAGYEERAFNASERVRTLAHRAHLLETDARGGLPETLDLAGVQNQVLDEETAILSFSILPGKSYVWVVTQEGMTTHALSTEELLKSMALYKRRMRGSFDSMERLKQFTDDAANILGLNSILSDLSNIKRLVIIPDGFLNIMPLDLLPLDSTNGHDLRILLDRYEIVHAPSATSVAISREQISSREIVPNDNTAAVLAISDFAGLEPLDGVAIEADSLVDIHGEDNANLLENDEVTTQNLQKLTENGYEVVHIGSHGDLGKWIISDGTTDIELTAEDIRRLDFSTDLLVLSFCESGIDSYSRYSDGDESVGRIFLEAPGIPRVISTLWRVDDEATARFMEYFYRAFQSNGGMSASQALRQAKLDMRNDPEYRAIEHWAAFKLEGDW